MLTPEEKKSIALKIKALFAKTTAAGCTEEEAMMAFSKGHELLEKYQIDLSDLELREEGTSRKRFDFDEVSASLYTEVGRYCECKTWRGNKEVQVPRRNAKGRIMKGKFTWEIHHTCEFLGLKSDAVFAEWLLASLVSFIANQQADYFLDHSNVSVAMSKDFTAGCVARLRERLIAEVAKRDLERSKATGRSLVPLKNAMIVEAFAKTGINLTFYKKVNIGDMYSDHSSYMAGRSAVEGVSFNRPVGSSDTASGRPLQIGSK